MHAYNNYIIIKSFIQLQRKRGLKPPGRLTSPLQENFVYKMSGTLKNKSRLKHFSHKNYTSIITKLNRNNKSL